MKYDITLTNGMIFMFDACLFTIKFEANVPYCPKIFTIKNRNHALMRGSLYFHLIKIAHAHTRIHSGNESAN
jgi:hypothetical protein